MSRLIVKNLPEKIKEEKFREIFSSAGGEITDLKLCFTRKGIFRKFGFVGYKNEIDAKNALNQLDKTFINTNKISIEICKDLGDDTAPRAWSKYSKDSSAHSRKTKEIQERKDRIKKLQESTEKPKVDDKKKKGKKKKVNFQIFFLHRTTVNIKNRTLYHLHLTPKCVLQHSRHICGSLHRYHAAHQVSRSFVARPMLKNRVRDMGYIDWFRIFYHVSTVQNNIFYGV